ncbi:MAG: GNAT family N-acetyltransferase [Alphaproteobacteria bacterium]|jgi:putative hemolysin|nr:GNAT family N-acetyltransferase [Alphaproteobacteria bacterium]
MNEKNDLVSASLGSLTVRLARDVNEVRAAQRLRYEVFYEEMAAKADLDAASSRLDRDPYDEICDHLLVLDADLDGDGVVGTYRLLRGEIAEQHGGFYSRDEYDLSQLVSESERSGLRLLELGRSCVRADYRTNPVVQLLWRGIHQYIIHHDIGLLFGCASLHGTEPKDLALPLSFLHQSCLAPPAWRARAIAERYVNMNILDEVVSMKMALPQLPPLIKGYLRLGGYIGEGAVVDHQFNTTDVLIILLMENVPDRYQQHFERWDS